MEAAAHRPVAEGVSIQVACKRPGLPRGSRSGFHHSVSPTFPPDKTLIFTLGFSDGRPMMANLFAFPSF